MESELKVDIESAEISKSNTCNGLNSSLNNCDLNLGSLLPDKRRVGLAKTKDELVKQLQMRRSVDGRQSNITIPKKYVLDPQLPHASSVKPPISKITESTVDEVSLIPKWAEGDLLWAKVVGHPWWPCIIAKDIDLQSYIKILKRKFTPSHQYHVFFFGLENERGWVNETATMLYEGRQVFEKFCENMLASISRKKNVERQMYLVSSKRKKSWEIAVQQSEAALPLSRLERLNKYSYRNETNTLSFCLFAQNNEVTSSKTKKKVKIDVPILHANKKIKLNKETVVTLPNKYKHNGSQRSGRIVRPTKKVVNLLEDKNHKFYTNIKMTLHNESNVSTSTANSPNLSLNQNEAKFNSILDNPSINSTNSNQLEHSIKQFTNPEHTTLHSIKVAASISPVSQVRFDEPNNSFDLQGTLLPVDKHRDETLDIHIIEPEIIKDYHIKMESLDSFNYIDPIDMTIKSNEDARCSNYQDANNKNKLIIERRKKWLQNKAAALKYDKELNEASIDHNTTDHNEYILDATAKDQVVEPAYPVNFVTQNSIDKININELISNANVSPNKSAMAGKFVLPVHNAKFKYHSMKNANIEKNCVEKLSNENSVDKDINNSFKSSLIGPFIIKSNSTVISTYDNTNINDSGQLNFNYDNVSDMESTIDANNSNSVHQVNNTRNCSNSPFSLTSLKDMNCFTPSTSNQLENLDLPKEFLNNIAEPNMPNNNLNSPNAGKIIKKRGRKRKKSINNSITDYHNAKLQIENGSTLKEDNNQSSPKNVNFNSSADDSNLHIEVFMMDSIDVVNQLSPVDISTNLSKKRKYVRKLKSNECEKNTINACTVFTNTDPEITGSYFNSNKLNTLLSGKLDGIMLDYAKETEQNCLLIRSDSISTGSDSNEIEYKVCQICEKIGGKIIICQGPCLGTYHLTCLGLIVSPVGSFRCDECSRGMHTCFICKKSSRDTFACSISTCGRFYHRLCFNAFQNGEASESTKQICSLHSCQTCALTKNITKNNKIKMYQCIRCPRAFHHGNYCLPASCRYISGNYIICDLHLQTQDPAPDKECKTDWCHLCLKVEDGLCSCSKCPISYHPSCVKMQPSLNDEWLCADCLNGRALLYGDVVWVKLGSYRWFAGQLCKADTEVPVHLLKKKHKSSDLLVTLFCFKNVVWMPRNRILHLREGDYLSSQSPYKSLLERFNQGLNEAYDSLHIRNLGRQKLLSNEGKNNKPEFYKHIKTNVPLANVEILKLPIEELPVCQCSPTSVEPCGHKTSCINRLMMYECHPSVCPARDRCMNQSFAKKLDADALPRKTKDRGWGLYSNTNIEKGQFIGEYVGELIDGEECRRRLQSAQVNGISNFYMLTLDKNRIIDAGPKGNYTRFLNHSCEPNCETQKWMVNGDARVGLFAIQDIPPDIELTFNYNLDSLGNEKKFCYCRAKSCSGLLGVRPKTPAALQLERRATESNLKKKVKEQTNECFTCHKIATESIKCEDPSCEKAYHLCCVDLTVINTVVDKFICGRHWCSICKKQANHHCSVCIVSFCINHKHRLKNFNNESICDKHANNYQQTSLNKLYTSTNTLNTVKDKKSRIKKSKGNIHMIEDTVLNKGSSFSNKDSVLDLSFCK